jgi:hypothetical protein
MGLFSRFRSRRSDGPSLVRVQDDDPKLEQIEQDATADVAAVEQDDKYFDPDSPGNQRP